MRLLIHGTYDVPDESGLPLLMKSVLWQAQNQLEQLA